MHTESLDNLSAQEKILCISAFFHISKIVIVTGREHGTQYVFYYLAQIFKKVSFLIKVYFHSFKCLFSLKKKKTHWGFE